jgi:hypothetical protein
LPIVKIDIHQHNTTTSFCTRFPHQLPFFCSSARLIHPLFFQTSSFAPSSPHFRPMRVTQDIYVASLPIVAFLAFGQRQQNRAAILCILPACLRVCWWARSVMSSHDFGQPVFSSSYERATTGIIWTSFKDNHSPIPDKHSNITH